MARNSFINPCGYSTLRIYSNNWCIFDLEENMIMWGAPGLVFFLPEWMHNFSEYCSLYQHCFKEIVELLRKFLGNRNWIFCASSFYGKDFGTWFTFLRYLSISTESYSAQEKVKNSVEQPNSLIIAKTSLFWWNQNCLVPLADWSIVVRFAFIPESEVLIPSTDCFTVWFLLLDDFKTL